MCPQIYGNLWISPIILSVWIALFSCFSDRIGKFYFSFSDPEILFLGEIGPAFFGLGNFILLSAKIN